MGRALSAVTAALVLVSLSACNAVVENRVETALVEAGLSPRMAACMAPMWADRLSVAQIRGIQRFATNVRAEGGQLTAGRLIVHARSWNDPEALLVVTTSAARCTLA